MKIFVFDPLWDKLITDELTTKLKNTGAELIVAQEIAPLTDCKELYSGNEERILCLNPDYVSWKLQADSYKDIPNLKAILTASTATTWIDVSYVNEHDISICNIRNFSTEAVAEWAVTMMFNLARQTPRLIKDGFPLDFDKDFMQYRGIAIHDKKAGIVGLGHIGSAIAKRCAGLGMEVVYWSRSEKQSEFQKVELKNLMAECDVIFTAMELNDETRKLITDDLVKSMKPSAIIITIQHDLFNHDLVLEMVKTGKLFGFGFEAKPEKFDTYEGNVWAAPEYGWATDESMSNCMIKWTDNMVNAVNGKYPNKVN